MLTKTCDHCKKVKGQCSSEYIQMLCIKELN